MDDPIEKLNMQHKEILNTLSQMSAALNTFVEKSDAIEIISQIQGLSTILEEHFLFEDDFLYPVLKKRPQEKVRDLAAQFSEELGDINSIFSKYKNDWTSPDIIIQLFPQFFSESKALLKAMQNRIKKEENELFPLI